jgi:hypothetical protein
MWIEAIVARDDLLTVLKELLPLKIHFDDDPATDRWLHLGKLSGMRMVSERGVCISCPAKLAWSVAGLMVPVEISSLDVLLRPEIVRKSQGDMLAFRLEIEAADIKGLPAFIDESVVHAVNGALASKDLLWNFRQTLSHRFAMSKRLEPIDSADFVANWGKCRITDEALVLAVSFTLDFLRSD